MNSFRDTTERISAEAYYRRGKAYEQLGNIAAREIDFAQAARNHMACIFFADSSDDSLRAKISGTHNLTDEQLIYKWQSLAVPTLGRGKCSFDFGDFEFAFKDFDAVIAAVPDVKNFFCVDDNEWVHYGWLDDWIDDLEEYFEPIITPRTFDEFNFNRVLLMLAYVGRGQCRRRLGDESTARADFDSAKTLGFDAEDFDSLRAIFDI